MIYIALVFSIFKKEVNNMRNCLINDKIKICHRTTCKDCDHLKKALEKIHTNKRKKEL